jgi:hypothetical protein
MKIKNMMAVLCLSLSLSATAGIGKLLGNKKILVAPEHFDTVGSVDSFQWAPERYENAFKYDIFYYIPKSLKKSEKVGSLIFTHGGGSSTMDRAGSINAVKMYMPDLKRMADELGIIVVLPSANGLNWGGHTRGLMKELARLMRKELNVDVDRMGVSGHSMGGMGITRNYLWTADEFAFFLPMAAGMDVNHQTEQHLNKVFNVPYVHLQGRNDHFEVFITRCEEQLKRTKDLEVQYATPSKLEITFYNGSHNYDYALFKSNLSRLITKAPRNLYQKTLYGSLHTVKSKNVENNITYDYESEARYFWVEATNTDLTKPERIDFKAQVVGNNIEIDLPVSPVQTKGLKIYLHSSMVDLNQKVEVLINGKLVSTREPAAGILRNMDANDPGFNFEATVDVTLN